MQERRNSIANALEFANALELHLSCTNPSISSYLILYAMPRVPLQPSWLLPHCGCRKRHLCWTSTCSTTWSLCALRCPPCMLRRTQQPAPWRGSRLAASVMPISCSWHSQLTWYRLCWLPTSQSRVSRRPSFYRAWKNYSSDHLNISKRFVQERRNSSTLAMELCLSCINPSLSQLQFILY